MDFADLGFEKGYAIMKAYSRSKLGNVLFTRELARRLEGKGVIVNTLRPGAVGTNIWSKAPGWTQPILAVIKAIFMITAEQGGQTLTYLAMSPEVEGKTGSTLRRTKWPSRRCSRGILRSRQSCGTRARSS